MLRFAINPEFSLCLDEAKTVLSAEAENEDAKTLLASLTFEGKPYAETVTAILDAAYTQGFLKDGNYDSTLRQEDGTYHSYVINADGNCSESVFIMGGPYIYTVAYFPGGNSCITYYDENGNICSQEDHVEDACIYSTYDESGNLIRVERIESDGSRTETTFNSSGEIVFWREYDANGVVISEEG